MIEVIVFYNKYDLEVIMNNNPWVIFGVEGNGMLINLKRVSDSDCIPLNEYP